MAAEPEEYLAVLKASYDYEPQSNDEIAIREDQLLLLKQRVDEEWVLSFTPSLSYRTSKIAGGRSSSRAMPKTMKVPRALCRPLMSSRFAPTLSFIPLRPTSSLCQQADHISTVKAIYDYTAAAPGELSVQENEVLLVFEAEQDWLLVQSQNAGGKAGFVPGNYVEAHEDNPAAMPHIIVPPSVRHIPASLSVAYLL